MLSTLKSKKKPRSKKYPHETETFFFSIFFQKGRFRKVLLFIHSRLFSVVWSSEDSLQKSVLCFCLGGSGNQTPVVQPDLATFINEKSCPALQSSFLYLFYSMLHFKNIQYHYIVSGHCIITSYYGMYCNLFNYSTDNRH